VLLWWLEDSPRLSRAARAAIADPGNEVWVSAASVWELAIKRARGRLRIEGDLVEEMAAVWFGTLPITVEHALAAAALPPHHDDPFDRMLVAQAGLEGLTLVTRDRRMAPYRVSLLPA
jgi:PIN domain nuclease of toxin-antitoxin system